jgi:hypothetical protein
MENWSKGKYLNTENGFGIDDWIYDRLCGLVVRVLGYRSRNQGSITGATRFSEFWNGVLSAS